MNLEQELGKILRRRQKTISVAESMTGGLVGDIITNVPGSSGTSRERSSLIPTCPRQELLGVRPETLRIHGAVSEQCALEMAAGVRERFHTKVGISVTGIAGPSGAPRQAGRPGHTSGTMTARCAWTDRRSSSKGTGRDQVAAAEHLIAMTLELLHEE